jgi:YggT family protein
LALIFSILSTFLYIMEIAIVIRALLSWFDPSMRNPISQFLVQLTEPIIAPIRRIIPSIGMIDISPMVAILVIIILQQMLNRAMVSG